MTKPSLENILEIVDCRSSAPDYMEQIQLGYMDKMKDTLQLALARAGLPLRDDALALYNELDEVSRARILLSAELGEIFDSTGDIAQNQSDAGVSGAAIVAQRIMRLITREHALIQLEAERQAPFLYAAGHSDIWSPLGDRMAQYRGGSWQITRAMTVGGHIILDFDSPMAARNDPSSGILSQPRLIMNEEERLVLRDKLDKALEIIDDLEPIYGALIRNFTRRIIVRKSAQTLSEAMKLGRGFSSEHSTDQRGSIKLLNFHFAEKNAAACTESLLHESLHVMLASFEYFSGYFTSRSKATRPVSPWSGNLIPNSSLSHAIFIYYACHRLFDRGAFDESLLSNDAKNQMRAKLQHFAVGFLIEQPLSTLFVDNSPIRDGLAEAIDMMQRRMQGRYQKFYGKAA